MLRFHEPADVYSSLVAELATSLNRILFVSLAASMIGLNGYAHSGRTTLFIGVLSVIVFCALRIVLICRHRGEVDGLLSIKAVQRYERAHWGLAWATAASVGIVSAELMRWPNLDHDLIGSTLVVCYCGVVISRMSIRPLVAIGAILIAYMPLMMIAVWDGGHAQHVFAAVMTLFVMSAVDTVIHSYRMAHSRIRTQIEMASLTHRDPLTKLLNRLGLEAAFDEMRLREGTAIALLTFDLDRFKPINDQFGHAAGDRVLVELARRLRVICGEDHQIARVSGDECVVLQPNVEGIAMVFDLAELIYAELNKPYDIGTGEDCPIGLSLGIACEFTDVATLDDLLRRADSSAYVAKRRGGGIYPPMIVDFYPTEWMRRA